MPRPAFVVRERPLRDDLRLAHAVVTGALPLSVLDELLNAGFTATEVGDLVINPRTLRHRRSRGEALSMEEAERAVRLARMLATADAVLGDRPAAWTWLREPNLVARPGQAHRLAQERDRRPRRRGDAGAPRARLVRVTLWRISQHADLSGVGGLYASGRWHTRGDRWSTWPTIRPPACSRCSCRGRGSRPCPRRTSGCESTPPTYQPPTSTSCRIGGGTTLPPRGAAATPGFAPGRRCSCACPRSSCRRHPTTCSIRHILMRDDARSPASGSRSTLVFIARHHADMSR